MWGLFGGPGAKQAGVQYSGCLTNRSIRWYKCIRQQPYAENLCHIDGAYGPTRRRSFKKGELKVKNIFYIIAFMSFTGQAHAGGHWLCDKNGNCVGGQEESVGENIETPKVTLVCERGTQVQFQQFSDESGHKAHLWITYPGQQTQTSEASDSGPQGARTLSFGDLFCTRKLIEQSPTSWVMTSSCEGKPFSIQCSRQ